LEEHYVRLGDKCIRVVVGGDYLRIEGGLLMEIRQRIVSASNVQGYRVYSIRGGKKKVVYIYYEEVGVDCSEKVKTLEELNTHLCSIRVTNTRVGSFATIITSGMFLLDYIVLGPTEAAIILSGKREVYVDFNRGELALYIV
jgi:hypothetical protein